MAVAGAVARGVAVVYVVDLQRFALVYAFHLHPLQSQCRLRWPQHFIREGVSGDEEKNNNWRGPPLLCPFCGRRALLTLLDDPPHYGPRRNTLPPSYSAHSISRGTLSQIGEGRHALAEECGAAGAVGEERGCRGRASVVVAWDVVQRVHLCREEIYLLNFGHGGPAEVPPGFFHSTCTGSSFPPHWWGQTIFVQNT